MSWESAVNRSLSRLLWLKDEIEAGRVSPHALSAYQELQARVEIGLDNMQNADTDAEAAIHWDKAAGEIRDFIALHPTPTRH